MSIFPGKSVSIVSILVAVVSLALIRFLPTRPNLLRSIADGQFSWSKSTTDVPISSVSVFMKSLLSRDIASLPPFLHDLVPEGDSDTLKIQPVRERLQVERLEHIKQICGKDGKRCDFNEQDQEFGLTALHLSASVNDEVLTNYLLEHGAVPVEDHAGRLPWNLSFTHFMRNAKAAKPQSEDCDIPIVDFGSQDLDHAVRETKRLVSEGEPVLLRGAYKYYSDGATWDVHEFVKKYSEVPVQVGAVPYASAFNQTTTPMLLGEYYQRFVRDAEAENVYVFNKHPGISSDGYHVLLRLLEEAFPMKAAHNMEGLFVHPNKTGHLDGIHYFFGRKDSGAPFHVHADAVNAAINGDKMWYILTPVRTVYSRKPVLRWVQEDLPTLDETDVPLQCLQRAGDVIYVPLDWGHAIKNLKENTFGVALELLNRRDTLAHLSGHA